MDTTTKAYKGIGMEGFIAKWYAGITGRDVGDFRSLARRVADQIAPGDSVLEVAPGPGYFAIELTKLGDYRVTGLDISKTFVEIAQQNATAAGVKAEFRQGNASGMPFENATFDFLVCRAAFKNFSEPQKAVDEMCRVLRPGGRMLLIDLRRDASPREINRHVEKMGMTGINSILTRLTFRFSLLKRAYTRPEFEQFFSKARFRSLKVEENLIGLEVSAQK